MNRWLLLGLGALGVGLLLRRTSDPIAEPLLASPLDGALKVTSHGDFGAARPGPPAHRHQGIDLGAKPGTFVRAIGAGVIVPTKPGLGKLVRKLRLDKPGIFATGASESVSFAVYADLGSALREPGERVDAGEPIAVVGSRGFFHFACKRFTRHHEQFFDPALAGLAYLTTKERVNA